MFSINCFTRVNILLIIIPIAFSAKEGTGVPESKQILNEKLSIHEKNTLIPIYCLEHKRIFSSTRRCQLSNGSKEFHKYASYQ